MGLELDLVELVNDPMVRTGASSLVTLGVWVWKRLDDYKLDLIISYPFSMDAEDAEFREGRTGLGAFVCISIVSGYNLFATSQTSSLAMSIAAFGIPIASYYLGKNFAEPIIKVKSLLHG